MNTEQYFCLELDNVATPSFTSFGKYYWGTLTELRGFIKALQNADYVGDRCDSLVEAFRAYEQGQTEVTHSVAFRDVPLLHPAMILHEGNSIFRDLAWTHSNIWGFPQEMRCKRVATRHLWVQCEQKFYRIIYAHFTDFEHLGISGEWRKVGEMLWGYPEILDYQPPHIYNRLAEPEIEFDSLDALHADWQSFQANPMPIFDEFCNDIFGDG